MPVSPKEIDIDNFFSEEEEKAMSFDTAPARLAEQIDIDNFFSEDQKLVPSTPQLEEPTKRPSFFEDLARGFDETASDIENLGDYLESRFPLGRISFEHGYQPPEELLGEDVYDVPEEMRRGRIQSFRESELKEKYGDMPKEDTAGSFIGELLGTVATPTSLLPVGQSLKAASAIGAGIGAFYGASEGLAEKGEVEVEDVALPAAVGAMASPAIIATGRALVGATKKVKDHTKSKSVEKVLLSFEDSVYDLIGNKGMRPKDAISVTRSAMGLSQEALEELTTKANKKLHIPTKEEANLYTDAVKLKDEGVVGLKAGAVSKLIEPISNRVKKISVPVWHRLRKLDYLQHARVHDAHSLVDPFLQGMNSLPKEEYKAVSLNLFNGDFKTAEAILSKTNPTLLEAFDKVKKVMTDLHKEAKDAGLEIGFVENYFPRIVKDSDKYLNYLGKEAVTSLKLAKDKAKKASKRGVLTPDEEAHITNVYLRGYNQTLDKGLGLAKTRSVTEITSDVMEEFYAGPEEALHTYIRKIINDTEKRYFFGKNYVKNPITGKADIGESVGKLAEDIPSSNVEELKDILTVRFGAGEQAPSEYIRTTKNILYGFTLGNPVSAITQIGDVFFSGYKNGILPTIKALVTKNKIKLDDYGFTDIAEEFADKSKSAKFLQKMFSWSGFTRTDRLGKETLLNSSLDKYTKQALKDPQALRAKWGKAFGKDIDTLVADLKAGNIESKQVRLLLWHDLADLQPVALSEMPEKYLSSPDARIFYMLKTFTIKQLNIIREDGIAKLRNKGTRVEGAKNLAKYSSMFLAAGMSTDGIKSWMLGRDHDIGDSFVENLWKLGGTNKFMGEKMLEHPATEAAQIIMPPLNVVEDMIMEASKALQDEEVDPTKIVKNIPLVGKLAHAHLLGGKEEFAEKKQKEEMKELGF